LVFLAALQLPEICARNMMPANIFRFVGVTVVSTLLGMAAGAQVAPTCTGMGSVGAVLYGGQNLKGAPYSATVKATRDQKLADGNAIHSSATTHQARDSAGRTMSQISAGCNYGPDGQLLPLIRVTVNDPESRTSISWGVNDSSPKVVRIVHQPEPVPLSSAEKVQRQQAAQMRPQSRTEVHSENLGSKIIVGVVADGSRTTRTIPAGEEGNDLPLETVEETWIAKDLRLVMLRTYDDPRSGRLKIEVVELNQGEPDPGLFAAPAGYSLEEQSVKAIPSTGVQ
jgi:hypothetical protein